MADGRGRGYLKRHGTPQTPADLAGHTCVLYGRERRIGWEFRVDGVARTFDVQGPLVANNGEVVRDAAIAGRHRAAADFIVGGALDSGALVPVLDAYAPSPITLNAVFPQHREGFVTLRVHRVSRGTARRRGAGREGQGGPGAVAEPVCGE